MTIKDLEEYVQAVNIQKLNCFQLKLAGNANTVVLPRVQEQRCTEKNMVQY